MIPYIVPYYEIIETGDYYSRKLCITPAHTFVRLTQLALRFIPATSGLFELLIKVGETFYPIARIEYTYDFSTYHTLLNALLLPGTEVWAEFSTTGFTEIYVTLFGEML